jgi:choline dehydrogenase-like flavoprotein
VGVSYESGEHRTSIKARREVIISAGAYNSPQLLMLSGVGDPDELKANGIKLVHPLPGVGENLMEHPAVFLQNSSHSHAGVQLSLVGLLEMMGQGIEYYGANAGKLRASVGESGGYLKTDPALPRRHTLRIARPLSLRKFAIVLKSGVSRPVSHINSTLRCVSCSSRRLD